MGQERAHGPARAGDRRCPGAWRGDGESAGRGRRHGDDRRRARTISRHKTAGEIDARSTHLDVTDEASWEAAVGATVEQLSGFDILVNNAGIEISGLIVDARLPTSRKMLEVNVLGTALGIKHGLRAMRPDGAAGQGGAIVNVSSVAATIAFPGIAGYSATKWPSIA